MDMKTTVRPIRKDDVPASAEVLARAFHDDPGGIWMFPDAARRTALLERFFALYIRTIALAHDTCLVTGDLDGAALWKPPGAWKVPPLTSLRILPATTKMFGRRLSTFIRGAAEMEKAHPREPHAYLPFIGVAPERQNHGVGSSLLVPVLRSCDEAGIGAYLEATSETNARLYERHGFEIVRELRVHGGLTLWPMWRDPR
jgi:ribosomal protein S18 acetylase RimI-like enzyme